MPPLQKHPHIVIRSQLENKVVKQDGSEQFIYSFVLVAEEKMKQHTTSSQTLKHTKRSVPSAQSSLRTIRSTPSKGSRKKSSNQSTETIREPVIPEGPLSYDQAFSAFKNNAEYNYKGLLEDIYLFGMEADTANQEYIKEVRKLREKNELLKKRQYELLQVGLSFTPIIN